MRAAESVEGVRVRRRRRKVAIDVEPAPRSPTRLAAPRGEPLLELARDAQEEVAAALGGCAGPWTRVDVPVGELA